MSKSFWNQFFSPLALAVGLWLVFDLATRFVSEWLWFEEVGYLSVFLLRLKTQAGLFAIAFFPSMAFLFGNLAIAQRLKYSKSAVTDTLDKDSYFAPKSFGLRWLLTLVILLSVLAGVILVFYLHALVSFWQPQIRFPSVSIQLPPWLPLLNLPQQLGQILPIPIPYWQVAVVWGLSIALGLASLSTAILASPQFWLRAIALAISFSIGIVGSQRWDTVLKYFYPTNFNTVDPLFQRDISFFVFSLPVWELLKFWILGLFLYGLAAVTLTYLLAGNTLSLGKFPGFSLAQIRHLDVLGSCVCAAIALHYWLGRYELLYSTRGATYGASFTDVTVDFPVYTALSLGSAALAVILLWQAIFSTERRSPWRPLRLGGSLIYGAVLYFFVIAIATYGLPAVIQRLIVEPNELARETPYIQHSIAYTRQAFDLARIEAETFNPQPTLTAADLQENDLTIRNIRLWDTRPLLETNRQLQQIRTYYSFPNADIDRYTLISALPGETTERRQTIIAARELDYRAIPQQAQTWVNQHLVYTHGYGFTLSPVNTVAAGGLPDYFIQNIGVDTEENGSLQIANEQIRASIPIGQPRIYYGEITDNYIMTGTRVQELDYPSGNENVYTTYDGRGGINIGSFWRRILFAQRLKDWQMLLTQDFTPQTQLLFRRNIRNRVQAIAPFLRYDQDPYLVAADGGNTNLQGENTYLYWILDAYTTSDRYPYSDPGDDEFNYIRNSVKVVIDAYNGSVDFYIADPTDPVINTIAAIFPGLLKPLDAMPAGLRSHIRYPIDLFGTQSEHLLTYHMTDAQVFYNREDLWRFPTEIYGNEPQQVQPYFLIMRLPTEAAEEFILLLPFNPIQRPNLIGWLAARSDGEQYGRLLLYEFPKQVLVYGPEQVEARINQDPVISQQITLWNRQGSRVIQGNLLVIPIEESLLYVEPLYLEAEQNSLPTFVRVIVAYENRIVMAETLQQALDAVFQPQITPATPIIRPVEDN